MNSDLNYKLNVEPAIFDMLKKTEEELARVYGMTPGDFQRAVWTWVMDKLVLTNPHWMVDELARMMHVESQHRTIEGEVGE